MLKKSVLALYALVAVGTAHAAGPTSEQVKQALYDRYATTQGAADLQKALDKEVAIGACEPTGEQYRCAVENKALGTSNPMVFAYDAMVGKWKFVKEESASSQNQTR
ncbi:hypothetical protein [Bordetella tumulicola]|uniref:hypothetical protein n=1 Tax=Bordetella tumulicola TaxID=1649133 RepID=UPI0039EEFEA1